MFLSFKKMNKLNLKLKQLCVCVHTHALLRSISKQKRKSQIKTHCYCYCFFPLSERCHFTALIYCYSVFFLIIHHAILPFYVWHAAYASFWCLGEGKKDSKTGRSDCCKKCRKKKKGRGVRGRCVTISCSCMCLWTVLFESASVRVKSTDKAERNRMQAIKCVVVGDGYVIIFLNLLLVGA